jgi:hypothetical protein
MTNNYEHKKKQNEKCFFEKFFIFFFHVINVINIINKYLIIH